MNRSITAVPDGNQSPFDAIRRVREDGTEYWSSRDLMPLMGYKAWQNMIVPIIRARRAAENQNVDLSSHFMESHKTPAGGGRAQQDFHLSRFAAYLVAMNGDPNKPEVAAAQAYFAIQTHVAETTPAELTGPELLARAVLEANSTIAAIEAENRALAPRADVADKFLTADGNYEVADAAKILTAGGVQTGRDRLFAALAHKGWIYRHKGDGKWRVKQSAIDSGHMAVLPKNHYHPKTGVLVIDPPQPRVTFKGIARIGADYGAVIDPTATAAIEQSGGNAA